MDQRQLHDPDSSFISAKKRQRQITGLIILGLFQACVTTVWVGIPRGLLIWLIEGDVELRLMIGIGMALSQAALLAFGLVFDQRTIYLRLLIAGFGWTLIALGVFQQFYLIREDPYLWALHWASFVFLFAFVISLIFWTIRITRGCTLTIDEQFPTSDDRTFSIRFLFAVVLVAAIVLASWTAVLSEFEFKNMFLIWSLIPRLFFLAFVGSVAAVAAAMVPHFRFNCVLASLLLTVLIVGVSIPENWVISLMIARPTPTWYPALHFNAGIVLPTLLSSWLIRFSGYRLRTKVRAIAGPMPISLPERV